MSYFNIVCDVCGRGVQGITWVNGMKFCAKCYQENFGNKNTTENLKNMYEAYLKILNEKDQQIAELEEKLKNSIRPKFKVEQEVFVIYEGIVKNTTINSITIFEGNEFTYYCKYIDGERVYLEIEEQDLFATKEEAEAKLRELTAKNV